MQALDSVDSRKFPIGESQLSDKQWLAIDLLISGAKLSGIAEQLQIDQKTLYNWRKLDDFREALDERRSTVMSESADEIRALISPSIAILRDSLAIDYHPYRFRAASTILRMCGVREMLKSPRK